MIIFSVVIPTFNRAADLRRALNSLVSQTISNFEVIVCDDGSSDNSREVVEAFRSALDISYSWDINWGGPARPRNIGIARARGEWVAFLDADDWWCPEKLESLSACLRDQDVIYHALKASDARGSSARRRLIGRPVSKPVFRDLMLFGNALPNSAVVVRKALILAVGGFREEKRLIAAEDYDLWLRLALRTDRFHFISEALGFYMTGLDNISRPSTREFDRIQEITGAYLGHLEPKYVEAYRGNLMYFGGRIYRRAKEFEAAQAFFRKAMCRASFVIRLKALFFWLTKSG